MLAQKGSSVLEALDAAKQTIEILGGGEPEILPVDLTETQQSHTLVVIPKLTASPAKYPRRPGIPSKRPLN